MDLEHTDRPGADPLMHTGSMPLRVVGAGLGRTGTWSLKVALERLLDQPCYHMLEIVEAHPEHLDVWDRALAGDVPDWAEFLSEYAGTLDWPAVSFWEELSLANPDAIVLLSCRPTDDWWRSATQTIFPLQHIEPVPGSLFEHVQETARTILEQTFTPRWADETAAKAAYERHNDAVRAAVPADRLVEWSPGDGWGPLCDALALPVPDEPFPHRNTTADFRANAGLPEQADGSLASSPR